jgi:hypothetical protein
VAEGFFHGAGEWDAVAEGGEEVVVGEWELFVEGFVEGAVDGFFDFGAAEAVGGGGEFGKGEGFGIAAAAAEMDGEYIFAFGGTRKIDEEDFVEATFAEEFGGEVRDVVGGGHDEDGSGFFGEPGEEGSEDAGAGTGIAGGIGGACEGFIDFIDPKDGWCDGFGDLNGAADVVFGGADEAAEHFADIEAEERHLPEAGDGFGGEALAAALHANEQDAAGCGEAEVASGRGEGEGAFLEPVLEGGKTAQVGEGFAAVVVFEKAVFADELAFFFEDIGKFVGGEAFLADEDAGEDVFGFVEGEATGGLEETIATGIVEIDFDLREAADVVDDIVEEGGEIGSVG